MRFPFFLFFSAFILIAMPQSLADDGVIGTIMEVEGVAVIKGSDGLAKAAAVETEIHLNDQIATGKDSRAMVLFIDDTEMTMSENTELKVDEYIFDPEDNAQNKARYNILRGTFYYISGLIAKKESPDVLVKTPHGAIGIRGTEFWGGDIDGEYAVLVADGRVDVTNDQGRVSIAKGQGSAIHGRPADLFKTKIWPVEKVARAKATIFLKRHAQVRQRIAGFQGKQIQLRAQQRAILKNKRLQKQGEEPPRRERPLERRQMKQDAPSNDPRPRLKHYGKNG